MSSKTPRSKMILYMLTVVIVYLLARAWFYNEPLSSGLAVGLVIGLALGTFYENYRVMETKQVLGESK